jgi:hypothetical protein
VEIVGFTDGEEAPGSLLGNLGNVPSGPVCWSGLLVGFFGPVFRAVAGSPGIASPTLAVIPFFGARRIRLDIGFHCVITPTSRGAGALPGKGRLWIESLGGAHRMLGV